MKKETVIDLIHNFFEEIQWKYRYDEERSVFLMGVSTDGIIGNIRMAIFVKEHHYRVYASLHNKAEKDNINAVAEYLHRANYGLNNGNFELDYHDGEVRYKIFVRFKGIDLSKDIIKESIVLPPIMFDKYGKNLIKLMLGEGSPKELIEEAEAVDDIDIT